MYSWTCHHNLLAAHLDGLVKSTLNFLHCITHCFSCQTRIHGCSSYLFHSQYKGYIHLVDQGFFHGWVGHLPKPGRFILTIGSSLSILWEWTLTYRTPLTLNKFEHLQALQSVCEQVMLEEDTKSQLKWSLLQSQPLARCSTWPLK